MTNEVRITTGCRLHFGLLAFGRAAGRQFGGAGLMLDEPGFQVVVRPAKALSIDAPPDVRRRVESLFRSLSERRSVPKPTSCAIEVERSIPAHCGLGSGTQLALAVARAASILAGEDDVAVEERARRTGRGRRSAIGVYGFQHGGLLVDGGRRTSADRNAGGFENLASESRRASRRASDTIAPLVSRLDVPSAWRLLLAMPEGPRGLSGADEITAFDRLPPMPLGATTELCRVLVMELLPAVADADPDAAGDALYRYGRLVGEQFAPVQGGVYASPEAAGLVERLRRWGIRGVGQSSWGPTIFALFPDQQAARHGADDLAASLSFRCSLSVARPLNHGASVEGNV